MRRRRRMVMMMMMMKSGRVEVLLYVHRNHRLLGTGVQDGHLHFHTLVEELIVVVFIGAGSWVLPIVSRQPSRVATGRQKKRKKRRNNNDGRQNSNRKEVRKRKNKKNKESPQTKSSHSQHYSASAPQRLSCPRRPRGVESPGTTRWTADRCEDPTPPSPAPAWTGLWSRARADPLGPTAPAAPGPEPQAQCGPRARGRRRCWCCS